MARRKNLPESVRLKCHLSERLREVRVELHGERGGSEMARRLGLPIRTWYNYESGVTVPAEVILRFVELTSVEPPWLLHGKGPKFRVVMPNMHNGDSVEALLRSALQKLETVSEPVHSNGVSNGLQPEDQEVVLIRVEGSGQERLTNDSGPRYMAARREWIAARRDCRCVKIEGDAMAPIVSDGAYVAFSDTVSDADELDGNLVLAWVEGQTLVRWFNRTGRYGVLRAENPSFEPATLLIDLESAEAQQMVRKVLWISTPH